MAFRLRSLVQLSVVLPLLGTLAGFEAAAAKPKGASAAQVKRGQYLVSFGGCNECHTPHVFDKELGAPVPDMKQMLSGHPSGAPDPATTYTPPDIGVIGPTFTSFKLPFGIVYSANLTPDKDTGLGTWTEDMFVRTMRNGRHLGGMPTARPILPPMPWYGVATLTDDDLKAVFAYLQSIPPVRNAVPDPKVPQAVIDHMSANLEKQMAGQKTNKAGEKSPAPSAPPKGKQ